MVLAAASKPRLCAFTNVGVHFYKNSRGFRGYSSLPSMKYVNGFWKEDLVYQMESTYSYTCDGVRKKQVLEVKFVCKKGSRDVVKNLVRFWDYCEYFDGKLFQSEGFGKTVVEIGSEAAC